MGHGWTQRRIAVGLTAFTLPIVLLPRSSPSSARGLSPRGWLIAARLAAESAEWTIFDLESVSVPMTVRVQSVGSRRGLVRQLTCARCNAKTEACEGDNEQETAQP